MTIKNDYLEQVQAKQQLLEEDLKTRAASPAPALAGAIGQAMSADVGGLAGARLQRARTSTAITDQAVDIRITGFWRWQTVIVPPNAYVVHTRRGQAEPLTLGLGVSFGFDPYRDAFLVVPSAMQTILINAHCICRELQGILVQGYVQWIIADFATAYKKLDFTDIADPMRVVNIQLREQAEAAIKDKVSTMSIDDVLSDKQPIIQELTARLRHVAEGEGDSDKGLGLRIVTVQIKEAVVSSARLWENLQKPFRADRDQIARLAELGAAAVIEEREREHQKTRETGRLETESEINRLRQAKEAEAFDLEQTEKARRHQREQEVERQAARERTETAKQEHELRVAEAAKHMESAAAQAALELAVLRAELERQVTLVQAEVQQANTRNEAANRQSEAEVGFERDRQEIANQQSPGLLQAQLIEALPSIAEKLPKPDELRTIAIGDGNGGRDGQALAGLIAQVMATLELFRRPSGQSVEEKAKP